MIDKFSSGFIKTVYDFNDYTLNELICKLAQKMDDVITHSNESFNYLEWLKSQGLSNEVIKIMIEWKENGTLETLINQNVFNELNNKIDKVNTQLNNIGFNFIQQGGVKGEYGNNIHILQTLINTLNTMGGGTIFFPEGTYYFERISDNADYCIKILSNVSICGAGRGRTIFKCGRNEDTSLYSLFWNCDQGNIKTNIKFTVSKRF